MRWTAGLGIVIVACSGAPRRTPEVRVEGTAAPQVLAATYSLSDGFDLIANVDVRANGTFSFVWMGCEGEIAKAEGRYVADPAVVRLQPASGEFRQDARTFATVMHRIRWGEREYLLPEERMLAFANAINAGREPRSGLFGVFYLRAGDERLPVLGRPSLEAKWARYLLPSPVGGAVTRVLQRETDSQRPIVMIDAGANVGLLEGMQLYASNARRPHFKAELTIRSVEAASATAVVDFQYNHIRVGDAWTSRRSDDAAQQRDEADEAR